MADETYVLKPGKVWEIDYEVMLNPKTPLNPGKQQEDYLKQATQDQLETYKKAIAQEQLTNPLLLGWNIKDLLIKKWKIIPCTTFSCIEDTNNAGYRIEVDYALIVDGLKASTDLTINVNSYTTWWDHDVLWLDAFLKEMWKTSPFLGLYKIVKWLGYKIYQTGKAVVKDTESFFDWIKKNWISLVVALLAALFIYINGRGKKSTFAFMVIVGIIIYWVHPKIQYRKEN